MNNFWDRAIVLVDMNAFFAAIEQHDDVSLRGKPVVITNGEEGTCIITCSYEARAFGVKTGMHLKEARKLCSSLVVKTTRPYRYAEVSTQIMESLANHISPDIEIFSVDEAFLDITYCQKLLGPPEKIGQQVRELIYKTSGLSCSVGVSGDKTTAKYAAKLFKPNGFAVIPPWEAAERLKYVPVEELCGIADGIKRFLNRYGVRYCGDVASLPISILGKRFGNVGRRIWYMCQGADPDPVKLTIDPPKTMGHGKVMPPRTRNLHITLVYLMHMSEKLAARLRLHQLEAQYFFIGVRSCTLGWLGSNIKLVCATTHGNDIYYAGVPIIRRALNLSAVDQIQVTALDPRPQINQRDFFVELEPRQTLVHQVMDAINQRYGEFTLAPAPLLHRTHMHNVIAPAWKPYGHRQAL